MKEVDLIDNEIYIAKAGTTEYLFQNIPCNKGHYHKYLIVDTKQFYGGTGSSMSAKHNSSFKDDYRLPTFDEKQHLLQCIQAGKYVEYTKISNNLILNYLIL